MASAPPPPGDERWVVLDVIRDAETAHDWLDALHAAGVDAELRFEDATRYASVSSAYPTGSLFVYPLLVPASQREEAARVLIDLGWRGGGNGGLGGRAALAGAALAAISALVLSLLLLAQDAG